MQCQREQGYRGKHDDFDGSAWTDSGAAQREKELQTVINQPEVGPGVQAVKKAAARIRLTDPRRAELFLEGRCW